MAEHEFTIIGVIVIIVLGTIIILPMGITYASRENDEIYAATGEQRWAILNRIGAIDASCYTYGGTITTCEATFDLSYTYPGRPQITQYWIPYGPMDPMKLTVGQNISVYSHDYAAGTIIAFQRTELSYWTAGLYYGGWACAILLSIGLIIIAIMYGIRRSRRGYSGLN